MSKVVKLTPPAMGPNNILQRVVCTRPTRKGDFNISVEQSKHKTIVHCYGHGGAGATTLFGSVSKAIALFEQKNLDKKKLIRIVGAGCMGLVTAIELVRRGYHVAGITAKTLYDIPSWQAAGYFALVALETSPQEQASVNEIGMETFSVCQQIEAGHHSYITKDAIRFLPVYASLNTHTGLEQLEAMGLLPPGIPVTLDFGNGVTHPNYIQHHSYFMNLTVLMQQFSQEIKRMGIPIQLKHLQRFDEVEEEVIFNCTGLGSKELNDDASLIPIRGHLLILNNQTTEDHMHYMIYTTVKQDGKEEYIYAIPKTLSVTENQPLGVPCQGVLGGTFIPHVDHLPNEEQKQLDEKEFQKLFNRSHQFYYGAQWTGRSVIAS